ncbi:MAG: PD-(D/E)XK nuclease family protein [Arcobacteraceae bacterium]
MLCKTLLVFPTSRAIRTHISKDDSNRLLESLLSIDEFFFKSITVANYSFIDEEHRFLLLKEATQIKNFSALGISNSFNDFIKQSEYLFRFFNEICAENIEFDSIKKADTYEFYEEHLCLLHTIYNNYCALLEKNKFIDKITLPKKYELNYDFLKQFEQITLFFEGYYTHFEFNLITKIASVIPLTLHLQTTPYNKKSYEKFIEYGFNLEENFSYELNISQKLILEKKPIKAFSQSIEIKAFSQSIHQVAYVQKAITKMIENNIKPEDIVLIVPDETFVQTLQLFDSNNYFNYAMGKEIKTSALYTNAYSLYQYLNEFEKKDIEYLSFLKQDIVYINETFKSHWGKPITKEIFTLTQNFLKKEELNKEILEKFEEECYKLENLVFNYKEPISFKEVYKFLLQRISTITTDDINSGVITVMGLLETRGLSFKGLIIVDFNEDIVPKRSIKDKFLSSSVKKHAKLPTRSDRENLQKYYYHQLCKNTSEIYISYIKNDTQSVSRFASELFNIPIDETLYDNAYKHILYASSSIKHFNEEIVLEIDLSQQEWSATSLKTYLQCKRKYYLHYIASIKEHHFSVKPQGFEIGTAIHSILEKFYSKYTYLEQSCPNTILNPYFNEYKEQNPFIFLDFEIWKRKLEQFIENEKQEFLTKEKKVYKTEMPFKFTYQDVTLKGIIDRIDKGKDFFEIIDYKTSNTLSVDTPKNYEKSVDFQLEFYFLAMKEYLEKNPFSTYSIKPYYYDLNKAILLEELLLDDKITMLKEILKSLKTTEVNFTKCEDLSVCNYCPYKVICNRE